MLLKIILAMFLGTLLACTQEAPQNTGSDIRDVGLLRSNIRAYVGQTITVHAYLISTVHGMHLADSPDARVGVPVELGLGAGQRQPVVAMMNSAGKARRGKLVWVRGAFVGTVAEAPRAKGWVFQLTDVVEFHEVPDKGHQDL